MFQPTKIIAIFIGFDRVAMYNVSIPFHDMLWQGTSNWRASSYPDFIQNYFLYFRPAVINTGVKTSSSPYASWSARPRGDGSNGVQGPPSKTFPDTGPGGATTNG